MGKQINYWMEYESFLLIAEAALEQGSVIYKEHKGKVSHTEDLSIVTTDCNMYYFHLPIAGELEIKTFENGREVINKGPTSTGNTIIEAGFSYIQNKRMTRNRLYSTSGYYTDCEEWIPRPVCIDNLYKLLVRKVKKLAPYTELSSIGTYRTGEQCGEEFEYKHKEYITPHCLELREKGYSLY